MRLLRGWTLKRIALCAVGILLFSILTVSATDLEKINKLAKECQAGKEKACKKLAKIAKKDKDLATCLVALEKLGNHSLAQDIAWNANYHEVRKAAYDKMDDRSSRRGTIYKLTDQAQLADIAMNAENLKTREEAVEKIEEPLLLADIARNSDIPQIRVEAIKKITDQPLLADIFKTDPDEWVRIRVLNKLSSQAMLESVFRDGQQPYNIRLEAIDILRDSGRFKIEQGQIVQTLIEMRQEALRQKNHDIYKKIISNLTLDNLINMRKRAPRATIQGQLIKRESGEPMSQTSILLGEMKSARECTLYSDLMTTTDEKGNFVLRNVPNGYYTVVYSQTKKPKLPTASVFTLDSRAFNASMQSGSFSGGRLSEGTSTISSMELGISLSFEVRDSNVVEFDVFGTGIKKLVFEVY